MLLVCISQGQEFVFDGFQWSEARKGQSMCLLASIMLKRTWYSTSESRDSWSKGQAWDKGP